jgi:hypothetical protein
MKITVRALKKDWARAFRERRRAYGASAAREFRVLLPWMHIRIVIERKPILY